MPGRRRTPPVGRVLSCLVRMAAVQMHTRIRRALACRYRVQDCCPAFLASQIQGGGSSGFRDATWLSCGASTAQHSYSSPRCPGGARVALAMCRAQGFRCSPIGRSLAEALQMNSRVATTGPLTATILHCSLFTNWNASASLTGTQAGGAFARLGVPQPRLSSSAKSWHPRTLVRH